MAEAAELPAALPVELPAQRASPSGAAEVAAPVPAPAGAGRRRPRARRRGRAPQVQGGTRPAPVPAAPVERPAGVDVAGLARLLGLEVHDERWYRQAFSHASYVNERALGAASNERLEFLGDAVLSLVVGRYLFEEYPELPEGELSRLRAAVVRASTLANRAKTLGIARFALLGKGEEQAGGRKRPGFLADLFEALIGAIFLDRGLEAAATFILNNLREELEQAAEGQRQANYKALLQEAVQRRGNGTIEYLVIGQEGPDHDKRWTCEVRIDGRRCGVGSARSKKLAEQEAAREALMLGWTDRG